MQPNKLSLVSPVAGAILFVLPWIGVRRQFAAALHTKRFPSLCSHLAALAVPALIWLTVSPRKNRDSKTAPFPQ